MPKIDLEVKTNFMNDKHRFVVNLIFTGNWIKSNYSEFLIPFGLSSQQFNILRILRGADSWVSMNEIKNLMIDKSPHTTRLITKLLEKNLIERNRSKEDRRVININITTKGLNLLKEIDKKDEGKHNEYMERISMDEAKQFSLILDKLRG